MICLHVKAPFAAFRTFAAGSYRPTAGFITPSAAYGFILNLAGIEMREELEDAPMTIIRNGLPSLALALGAVELPHQQSVLQQLHNYPVGGNKTEKKAGFDRCKGQKYNIAPVRRGFLSNINAYLVIQADDTVENAVCGAVKDGRPGYGLPFLGDNDFLIDSLAMVRVEDMEPAHWFEKVGAGDEAGIRERTTRLTITIDRQEVPKTRSALFAPTKEKQKDVPPAAWIEVAYR